MTAPRQSEVGRDDDPTADPHSDDYHTGNPGTGGRDNTGVSGRSEADREGPGREQRIQDESE